MAEKTKNKYTRWAMGWSTASVAAVFLMPVLDLILAGFAMYLGVRALKDYQKNNSIGGKTGAITAIVISSLILLIALIKIVIMLTGTFDKY